MSRQESAGDAPSDTVEGLMDVFSCLRVQLDSKHADSEEAMKVRQKNIDSASLTYPMTHSNRGVALIINNEEFLKINNEETPPRRHGSTQDANRLKKVLGEMLNFNVIVCNNMTVKQMKNIFEDIAQSDHSQNDCFLAVILSHGKDGGIIYGTDGTVALDDLISYILPNKCPSLGGKPKLFFVQACRGTKLDKGVEVKDGMGSFGADASVKKIPLWADILIAFSSVPGYYSSRNDVKGSWFIQSLCYMFERYGNNLEIHQILTKVNFRVAYEYESKSDDQGMNRMKQVPCVASMLTKELKFSPKQQKTLV